MTSLHAPDRTDESPPADFDGFLRNLPLLHSWDDGQTWNTGGFNEDHLRPLVAFLRGRLPPRPALLETGAGCSTIAFLFLDPGRLVSIAPSAELYARIRSYCEVQGIAASVLDSRVGFSEWVLPVLAQPVDSAPWVDFALIDGGHGWPTPFVDFFYANHMLRRGGYVMVDDVQIHAVKELARLLAQQPGFELALDLGKSLVFRKTTADRALPEWNQQPYILRCTDAISHLADPFAL